MRTLKILAAACLAIWMVPAASAQPAAPAQPPLHELPGYFPLEKLGILGRDDLSVEINLMRPLLRLVAAATRSEEPEFAELIANLDAVRVRVAPLEDLDVEQVRGNLAKASDWLEANGWQTVVRVREDDEELYIYLRELEGEIAGLAVLALEAGGEAAVVNIVGKLDLSQLERLGEAFDIPQLSRPQTPRDEAETAPDDETTPEHEKGSDP